jgi:membrane associated rhomboid family serine protease
MSTPRHRAWALGTSDAESVLAEARKALFVMVAFLAILWIVQLANVLDHYQLITHYGIRPRDLSSLPEIISAPFLHVSWTHIEGNSGPLFIFGFLAAYRGVVRFLGLTGLVIVASGLADWFFGSAGTLGVGASGVVFGYLGYILVRGFFDRHGIDIMIGAVMALCFAYQFTVLLPHAGIGWQAHIGGLVAGVVGGWIFRDRSAKAARKQAKAAADRPLTPAATPGAAAMASAVPAVGLPSAGQPAAGDPAAAQPAVSQPAVSQRTAGRQVASTSEQYSGPRADIYRQLDDLGL